jgi:predicted kinase
LAFYASVIGHPVTSGKELSKAEASQTIDALTDATEQGVQPATGEVIDAEVIDAQTQEPVTGLAET